MNRIGAILLAILLAAALAHGSAAQDDVPAAATESSGQSEQQAGPELPPPIYEEKLLRLSEILGALSFLRDLCGESDGRVWRNEMSTLLNAENPGPSRRTRLIARFNHGFETFNAVYRTCTPAAERSIARYLAEGEALAADVRSRYSQ